MNSNIGLNTGDALGIMLLFGGAVGANEDNVSLGLLVGGLVLAFDSIVGPAVEDESVGSTVEDESVGSAL